MAFRGDAINVLDTRYVNVTGDTMTGNLDMGANNITTLGLITTGAIQTNNYRNLAGTESIVWSAGGDYWLIGDDIYVQGTIESGSITIGTGNNFTIGTTQWNSGDSIDGAAIADDTIGDLAIDWGTGANQVSAIDIPIADSGTYYTGTETETALQEIGRETAYADSPGVMTGGEITEGTNAGTFKVAALTALLRVTDSLTAPLIYVSLAEQDNQTIPVANTTYFVSLNYNGGSPTITLETSSPYDADKRSIPLGKVMKDGSDNVHYISGGFGFQGGVMKLHQRAEYLRSKELASGSVIAYSGTNNFTMTSGIAYVGINRISLSSYDSAVTQFIPVYRDGGGGWTEGAARNTIDYAHYDDGDGTLGDVGVSRYSTHWVYKHIDDNDVYVVYGRGSYKLAEAVTEGEPSIPDHLSDFGCLIGKIIAPQAGGSFAAIQMVTDTFFVGTAVADHNQLGSLQGGTTDEYYHLTATQHGYIDQDVTSGSSPTFDGSNFTGIPDGALDTDYVEVAGDTMTGALLIDGSADAIQLKVQAHSTQNANILEIEDSGGTDLVTIDPSGNVYGQGFQVPDGGYVGYSGGPEWLFDNTNGDITTTSSVGIGMAGPSQQLHVYHATDNVVATFESGDSEGGIQLKDSNTTADYKVTIRAIGDELSLRAGGNETMRIDSSGRVGIGTASPGEMLHIENTGSGDADSYIRIESSDTGEQGRTGN